MPANERGKLGLITLNTYATAKMALLASVSELLVIEEEEEDLEDSTVGTATRKRARTESSSSCSSNARSRPAAAPKVSQQQMLKFMDGHSALKAVLTQEMKSVFTLLTSSTWMDEDFKKDVTLAWSIASYWLSSCPVPTSSIPKA